MKSNRFLMGVGWLFVFAPTAVFALLPVFLSFRSQRLEELQLAPLVGSLVLGLVLSLLWYRFSVRWWVGWAFRRTSNPGELKRRALSHGILAEKNAALIPTERLLEADEAEILQGVDAWLAQGDDLRIPPAVDYYIGDQWMFRLDAEGIETSEGTFRWTAISEISFRKMPSRHHQVLHQVKQLVILIDHGRSWSIMTHNLDSKPTLDCSLEEVIPVMRFRCKASDKQQRD